MNAQMLLQSFAGGAEEKTYIEDVFSTYLYTGNGSTQTINNGIDLAGKGGLVWTKSRGVYQHILVDTMRDVNAGYLRTNDTDAQTGSAYGVTAFGGTGYDLNDAIGVNANGTNYVSWAFRKAPKFFDIVTSTANGNGVVTFNHSLGVVPGLCVYKRIDGVEDWVVRHISLTPNKYMFFNRTDAKYANGSGLFTESGTSVSYTGTPNAQYVAYLWAHDPSPNGLIQCGSYTGNGGVQDIDIGFEPQMMIVKNASAAYEWCIFDSMRGVTTGGNDALLYPDLTNAEYTATDYIQFNAKGFGFLSGPTRTNTNANTYIYLAIRRPNKPPKTGAEVYNAIARTGTGADVTISGLGLTPDLNVARVRDAGGYAHTFFDRLRGGGKVLESASTNQEPAPGAFGTVGFGVQNGVTQTTGSRINNNGFTYINHFFRRAPGFFDVVCYTGTGVARTVNHNLGVAPELMLVKCRGGVSNTNWAVYSGNISSAATKYLILNNTTALQDDPTGVLWSGTAPTNTLFSLGSNALVNTSGATYVAYLFASLPGISKVGSYTGNGTSLSVECGFSTGARFILVKSIDDVGDWFIWDTARGVVAANDPHLSLNTTAAEVTTDDSVDPYAGGFIVNQNTATNINIAGKRYIFLAIA